MTVVILCEVQASQCNFWNYPQEMKADESKLDQRNSSTGKVKPQIQRRTIFHSNTAPEISTVLHRDHLVSSSTNGHHYTGSLPRSKSPSSLYTDFTASLPSNFDPKSYQEFQSESPYVNADFTASLPSNFGARRRVQTDSPCFSSDLDTSPTSLPSNINTRQLQRRPVPKPRSFSCNDAPNVKSSNQNCPPKVNYMLSNKLHMCCICMYLCM